MPPPSSIFREFWSIYVFFTFLSPISLALIAYYSVGEQQYYPTAIYFITSPISILLYYNLGIIVSILFVRFLIRLFFGTLSQLEIETTWEKLYLTVLDGFLALTIFRSEVNSLILFLFFIVNLFKAFYWVTDMRSRRLEAENASKIKILSVLFVSSLFLFISFALVSLFFVHLRKNGISVHIYFLSEFLILSLSFISICSRTFILYISKIENRDIGSGPILFYLDIVIDITRSIFYIIFFLLTMFEYGLPIHLLHDLSVAIHSAWKRIQDLNNYRKLNAYFDKGLRNASPEQLQSAEKCSICFENMTEGKVTACNHVFHGSCLRRWLETSMECPLCRSAINLDQPLPPLPPTQHQDNIINNQQNTEVLHQEEIMVEITPILKQLLENLKKIQDEEYSQENEIIQNKLINDFSILKSLAFSNQSNQSNQSINSISSMNTIKKNDQPFQGDPETIPPNSDSFSENIDSISDNEDDELSLLLSNIERKEIVESIYKKLIRKKDKYKKLYQQEKTKNIKLKNNILDLLIN